MSAELRRVIGALLLTPSLAIAGVESSGFHPWAGWDFQDRALTERSSAPTSVADDRGALSGPVGGFTFVTRSGWLLAMDGHYLTGDLAHRGEGVPDTTTDARSVEGRLLGGTRTHPWGETVRRDFYIGIGYERLTDDYGAADGGYDREQERWTLEAGTRIGFNVFEPWRGGFQLDLAYQLDRTVERSYNQIRGADYPQLRYDGEAGYEARFAVPFEWATDAGGFALAPYVRYGRLQQSDASVQARGEADLPNRIPGTRLVTYGFRFVYHPTHTPDF